VPVVRQAPRPEAGPRTCSYSRAVRCLMLAGAGLEQLLKIWDWGYGDVSSQRIDKRSDIGWTLADPIAGPLARDMGRMAMKGSQLAILIRAVCREPTGIPTT